MTIKTERQGEPVRHATSYLINSPCLSSEQQTLAEGLGWCQLPLLLILFLTSVFGPAAVRHSNLSRLKVPCCCLSAFHVALTLPPSHFRTVQYGRQGSSPPLPPAGWGFGFGSRTAQMKACRVWFWRGAISKRK